MFEIKFDYDRAYIFASALTFTGAKLGLKWFDKWSNTIITSAVGNTLEDTPSVVKTTDISLISLTPLIKKGIIMGSCFGIANTFITSTLFPASTSDKITLITSSVIVYTAFAGLFCTAPKTSTDLLTSANESASRRSESKSLILELNDLVLTGLNIGILTFYIKDIIRILYYSM